jgi:glycerol-3-phosphate dehydrogenase subunit B
MKHDVVVIGIGMAGLIAAAKAASRGKKVLLVAKGQGTLPLTSGCIGFWGYRLANPRSIAENPYEEICQLVREKPEHPYGKVIDILLESVSFLQEVLSSAGYELYGSLKENQIVLTSLGTVHPAALVPKSLLIRKRESIRRVVAVGFKGYGDFYPQMFLDNLDSRLFPRVQKEARIIDLGIRANLKSNYLANLLSNQRILQRIIQELLVDIQQGNVPMTNSDREDTLFVLPAVLGENCSYTIWRTLTTALSAQVIEAPGLPPSIPGLRLQKALMRYLADQGVEIRANAQVSGYEERNGRVSFVKVLDGSQVEHRIEAKNFILATGSFWGGGLNARQDILEEPVFNLPVKREERLMSDMFMSLDGQAFLSAGLEVSESLRPNPNWANLYCAGSILAYSNYAAEKSGLGLALATGYKTGSLV